MKYLIILLISGNLYALPQTKRINAAVNSIPQAYSTAAGSLLLSEAVRPSSLLISNQTATEIEVNCSHTNEVPTASEGSALFVPASVILVLDNPSIKGDCYIRSMGGTISSGTVTLTTME